MPGIDTLGCRVDFVLGGPDWADSVLEEPVNGTLDCGNGFVTVALDWEDGWVLGTVLGAVVGILGWKIGWLDGWGTIVFGTGPVALKSAEDGTTAWGATPIYDCGPAEGSGKPSDEVTDCVGGKFTGSCFGALSWGGPASAGLGNWMSLGGCEGGTTGWIPSCLDFAPGPWFQAAPDGVSPGCPDSGTLELNSACVGEGGLFCSVLPFGPSIFWRLAIGTPGYCKVLDVGSVTVDWGVNVLSSGSSG